VFSLLPIKVMVRGRGAGRGRGRGKGRVRVRVRVRGRDRVGVMVRDRFRFPSLRARLSSEPLGCLPQSLEESGPNLLVRVEEPPQVSSPPS